tara:strand:+ start:163 stop:498 length:336 start_codon:yes stop_codon:yes gene_type:complete
MEAEAFAENTIYGYNNKKTFYSNIVGTPIVNAVTGAKYPWEVGSKEEKKFFKVTSTIAYGQKKGDHSLGSNQAGFAFYESPQEYMDHTGCKLSGDVISNWHDRVVIDSDKE